MRPCAVLLVGLLPLISPAQSSRDDEIISLLKRLGSSDFQQRVGAHKALQERPDAVPALREALRDATGERRTRITEILDFHDRRPVRELHSAIDAGNMAVVFDLLADWPNGKFEIEVWRGLGRLSQKVCDLHEKHGGKKINLKPLIEENKPSIFVENKITESTKAEFGAAFLFGREIDIDHGRAQAKNFFSRHSLIATSGNVKTIVEPSPFVIIARGNVTCYTAGADLLVISGGDVVVTDLGCPAIIIARGKIKCDAFLVECRIISGSTVTYRKKMAHKSIISENDQNPLGFIRWTEAPKDKTSPKSK